METIVRKKPTANELETLFKKIAGKGVDVRKYSGKIKAKGNPVTLQKNLRNEWE